MSLRFYSVGVSASFAAAIMLCESSSHAVPPALSNQTAAAGVSMTHSSSGFSQSQYAGGGSCGDFNNDGWQDLIVMKGGIGNMTDRLFINNGDGTFTDQAVAWGLTLAHKGKGTCVGDFNRDGWLDIYVTSSGPYNQGSQPGQNKLYKNNGNNTFTNVAASAGVATVNPAAGDSWSACFGDYDLDGDLDLYVGGFLTSSPSNAGNRLFRNNFIPDETETFTDVTATIGLFSGVGPVANLANAFADMDGDRYPELLLSADFKNAGFVGSRYFKNDGDGTFTDLTNASNTGDEENGMGQTRGDFNNDARLDWYVTSIYGFPPASWTGNKLYKNVGPHTYVEIAAAVNVDDGGYGWGAVAVDFNHDTWLDIAETNGDAGGGQWTNEQKYLFINGGNNTFSEMATSSGFANTGKGRGLIAFDYDNDGDQDLLHMNNNEPIVLYRNDLAAGPDTNWLRVFLDSSEVGPGDPPLAPNGYGSKVYATVGANVYLRSVDGGNSFLGISELSAHFGLGSATVVDQLRVDWANGTSTVLTNVATNQTITVSSGPTTVCLADLDASGDVDVDDLLTIINAWGPCADPDNCPADIAPTEIGDDQVNVDDMLMIINAWGPCL